MSDDWNRHLKRIAMSHRMDKRDIADCCALGGLEVSVSRAEGWRRGQSDTRRHVRMSADDFEAFAAGLPMWAKTAYEK